MNMGRKLYFYLIPFGIVLAMIAMAKSRSQEIHSTPTDTLPIPAFNLPSLFNPLHTFSNKNLKGRVVLLNFWATWCRACRAEAELLVKIKKNYSIPIYGINIKDSPERAKSFLANYGNPYVAVGSDFDGETVNDFNLVGIPETFLIDAHGVIRYIFMGTIDEQAWDTILLPKIQQYQNEQRDKIP